MAFRKSVGSFSDITLWPTL